MKSVGGRAGARLGQVQRFDGIALLRSQIRQVHQLLDEHVAAATELAKPAPALQREILSLYAHALCVEDVAVNLLLRATSPLFASTWIGGQLVPWDLASIRGYAEVVHAGTDVMLARLTPANLRMPVDLTDAGLGRPDATWVLNTFILWTTVMTCGEIAAKSSASGRTGATRRETHEVEVVPRNDRSDGVHIPSPGATNGVASVSVSAAP